MLISKKVKIHRIVSGTWKHLIFDFLTCILSYFVYAYLIKKHFEIPAIIPTVLGTALSFFIGFSNNQAYDRWWEARKIWGALVNESRTWARQILNYVKTSNPADKHKQKAIFRHIAFLYALKENLRKTSDKEYHKYLEDAEIEIIESKNNKANAILDLQVKTLEELYENKTIDGFKFMELNKTIVSFCDEMGKSERISNTVFPTTYNYYTRIFIWVFIISITMFSANYITHWSILAGTLIGYIFLTTHKIGESLINPFEKRPSGIPLNQITRTIEINLLQSMGKTNLPDPVQPINNEYIL